ncbi:hypothetical protein [Aeromonas caviae]
MPPKALTWDQTLRFRLLEIVLQWEGRLTTNHLCTAFNIGRQQASRDINLYLNDFSPEGLVYDKRLKGYKPTAAVTVHRDGVDSTNSSGNG